MSFRYNVHLAKTARLKTQLHHHGTPQQVYELYLTATMKPLTPRPESLRAGMIIPQYYYVSRRPWLLHGRMRPPVLPAAESRPCTAESRPHVRPPRKLQPQSPVVSSPQRPPAEFKATKTVRRGEPTAESRFSARRSLGPTSGRTRRTQSYNRSVVARP